MIYFTNKSGRILNAKKVPVAVIDTNPHGNYFAEINEDFFEERSSPHPDLRLEGFIDDFFLSETSYFSDFINTLLEVENLQQPIFFSILEVNIQELVEVQTKK